jgi:hypothetical protein
MAARDPRREAQDLVGPDHHALVLEPSPPAVAAGPWFADDPVVAPADTDRPVVSPVGGGDLSWDDWLADHPRQRSWAARRWLGGERHVAAPPETLSRARLGLHRLAAYVLSPARRRANTKIALRWTLGGFGTPFFGDDEQVRVDGAELVAQQGERARTAAVTTIDDAAAFVLDDGPDVAWARQFDIPDLGDPNTPLAIDPAAATWLGDWFGFGTAVLETVRADPASVDASRPQLWPEHFDIAFECLSEDERRRAGFGVSPGDADHDEPYLYVTLWFPDDVSAPSTLWNAEQFGGAILPLTDVLAADDQVATAVAFLRSRRDALARPA